MMQQRKFSWWTLFSGVWIVALMAYILAGVPVTPFHGDESTLIHNTNDYALQFIDRDLSWVLYDGNPEIDPMDQQYRLLDGRVHKYLAGFFWHLAGYTADDLNRPWLWGADWDYNLANGHIPEERLLHVTRLASAILMAAGVLAMFGLARAVMPTEPVAAFVASLFYAIHPVLLLNGRRSMMEGALMGFSLFTVWAAVIFIQQIAQPDDATHPRDRRKFWLSALVLGVVAGLTLSSKLTGVLVVGLVFIALGLFALVRDRGALGGVMVSGLVAAAVFYALNPTWWGDPVARVLEVAKLRTDFIQSQSLAFDAYPDFGARVRGFLNYGIITNPQFYEVAEWQGFIGDQIAGYLASPFAGFSIIRTMKLAINLVFSLLCSGLWAVISFWAPNPSARWVVGVWAIGMIGGMIVMTHLPWQRYYLPAILPLCLLVGLSVGQVIRWHRIRIADAAKP